MSRPVARPIAQIPAADSRRSGPGVPLPSTRKEAAPSAPSRISARQLERIARSLSDLDVAVLNFVSARRLVTGTQLVRRFWLTLEGVADREARTGRRALKRLSDWRVLDPLKARARGGTRGGSDTLIYSVGVAGVRLLARRGLRQRRLGLPGDRLISHTLTTSELVVQLFEADRAGRLELIEAQSEPECWRPFLGTMAVRRTLKPDLFLRVAGPGSVYEWRWFCEIDLATEHVGALTEKLRAYQAHRQSGAEQRDHGVYPRVVWIVPDRRRADQLHAVIGHLPATSRGLFSVCVLDEAVGFLETEAGS